MACIAIVATLPAAGNTAEQIANENARLAAFTDVDAFSAIPSYLALLGGDPAALADLDLLNGIPGLLALLGGDVNQLLPDGVPGYAALSALQVFFGDAGVFGTGGIGALSDYDALSAVPSYVALAQATSLDDAIDALGGIDAFSALPVFRDIANATSLTGNTETSVASILGGYAALSAADTFFGDGPIGTDGNPIGGVFTGGGIDALAPDADGNGGYAALSALPVFFGPDTSGFAPFGPGVFAPGGGIGSLTNYDALSAIPAYLDPPTLPLSAQQNIAPAQAKVVDPGPTLTTLPTGSNLVKLPDFTPPAPPKISNPITTALSNVTPPVLKGDTPDVTEPDTPSLPVVNNKSDLPTGKPSNGSYSGVFKPNNPVLLFGSGGGNGSADNGIRGWDKVVNGIKGALGGDTGSSDSAG